VSAQLLILQTRVSGMMLRPSQRNTADGVTRSPRSRLVGHELRSVARLETARDIQTGGIRQEPRLGIDGHRPNLSTPAKVWTKTWYGIIVVLTSRSHPDNRYRPRHAVPPTRAAPSSGL
jgi:hypothetical protein